MVLLNALLRVLALATCLLSTVSLAQSDPEIESAARLYLADQVQAWIGSELLVEAVRKQNKESARLSQKDVDQLDQRWRQQAEAGEGAMIERLMGNSLSAYLMKVQRQTNGLITEILVMDNKGLNVGLSSVTSDYWQGDEGKWQKTYLQEATAVFVDEVKLDESSQRFQVQVSVPLLSSSDGKAIGAVTIGIDAEGLLMI